jgi:Ribosomal protein L10
MPKSKRAKLVTLSKVNKKGKEGSLKLFTNVRESVDKYQYCFVFSVENMRNTYLKALRSEFSLDSRFVLGSEGLPDGVLAAIRSWLTLRAGSGSSLERPRSWQRL